MTRSIEATNPADRMVQMQERLDFMNRLQRVTNRIHATSNVDEIMLEMSADICALFKVDRLSIYTVNEEKTAIISKVKTGLTAFKDIRLAISENSVAGYVAMTGKLVNIRDVYDDAERARFSPEMRFLQEVDKRTGYRTKQILAAPIHTEADNELLGVLQLINTLNDQPFTPLAEEGAIELSKTLAIALRLRSHGENFQIRSKFDYLVTDGVIAAPELELAVRTARRTGADLESVLIDEFQVPVAALGQAYARFFRVDYEPFQSSRVKPMELLKRISRDYVESNHWLPLDDTEAGLVILTPDPEQIRSSRIASQVFPKHKLIYRVCTQRDFNETIQQFYGMVNDTDSVGELLTNLGDEVITEDAGSADDVSGASDNELVKLVNKVIMDAYQQKVSDIHVEPYPGKAKMLIRFRKDGALMPYLEVPAHLRSSFVARLKIMCDLDISEKRKPQDGKIKLKKFIPSLDIELRVATIPTQGGLEDIVMRILASGEPLPLDKLGLSPRNEKTLKQVISKPYGLFFVCGPTGSGKTTTLHSVLKHLNTPDTKIWTAEDPVEITQVGLRQVQVNPKAGLSFAVAMKAFLRADPDVIMVGEMRDKETTSTGIEASLTGHLVLATLHTNSAPESIIRLLDMGMDPFNFSDALLGILAQRLARTLCPKCKEAYEPGNEELKEILTEYCSELEATRSWQKDPQAALQTIKQEWSERFSKNGKYTLYRPKGCAACDNTGYKGRIGLHELLVGSDAIKKKIQEHGRVAELFAIALDENMRTLKQDGIEKVMMGFTDLHQVRAVCIK